MLHGLASQLEICKDLNSSFKTPEHLMLNTVIDGKYILMKIHDL